MVKSALLLGLLLLAACAATPQIPPAARSDLAPTGKLRVGLNFNNQLLAYKDPESGEPRGVAVALGRELARRLEVPFEIVAYRTAGPMADAAPSGVWDVAFLGAEAGRSAIEFTPAYLQVEASYLVQPGSSIRTLDDVDRTGARVAVLGKSAYDFTLSRTLKRAQIVRATTADGAFETFVSNQLEALADLKLRLTTYAAKLPGSRILDGGFTTVQQAIGIPQERKAGAAYLREFVEDVKTSGFVAREIENTGVPGASVAPASLPGSR